MGSESNLPDEAREALARGNKIEAIKRVREATGLGLKEAKDLVDDYVDQQRGMAARRAPGSGLAARERAGNGLGWLALLVLIGAVAWYFLGAKG